MRIGAQFYTLRDYCKNLDDFALSLRKVADIGYKTVQISATCPFEAEWLKAELAKNGLECVLTHTPVPRLTGELDKVCDEHKIFGCHHVGLGYYSFDDEKGDTYEKFMETFAPVAKGVQANGLQFMYHNHDNEFRKIGGKLVLEKLMEDFTPEQMGFTVDTFWVQAGGGDPAQWIEKLSGRIPCIHLKDFAYGRKMAPIGEGNINFDRVFEKAAQGGCQYMLVEQDDCNGEDPFDCLKRSYDYLKSRGFE